MHRSRAWKTTRKDAVWKLLDIARFPGLAWPFLRSAAFSWGRSIWPTRSAYFPTFSFSRVRLFTCSWAWADTAETTIATDRRECADTSDGRQAMTSHHASLRAVVPGDHQLACLHHLRLHLLQAADRARLALVRRLLRLPGRAVHRDVRLPADDLSALGLAAGRYPSVDLFSHDAGHLLETLFGWKANPHLGPFHLLSSR